MFYNMLCFQKSLITCAKSNKQGCYLTGAWEPEAPKTCSWAANIFNKEPEWAPNISDYDYLMGLGITSIPTSTEFGLKLQQKLWLS